MLHRGALSGLMWAAGFWFSLVFLFGIVVTAR
jgi:hypothetical protein